MPMKEQLSRERNTKITSMCHERQHKVNSLQDQFAQMQKEKTPVRGYTDAKFEDRIAAVKNEKFRRQRHNRSAERGEALKSPKPWPGRRTTTVDELVKHMSNVPSYLQHTETVDHLQDKALNVGVLEWGVLARWTHQQKYELSRSRGASPSNTSGSLQFSSPSRSSASSSSKVLESKQSPVNGRQYSSVRSQQSSIVDNHLGYARYSPGSKSTVLSLPSGHGKNLYSENGGGHGKHLPSDHTIAASGSDASHKLAVAEERRKKESGRRCSRSLFTYEDNKKRISFDSQNSDSMYNDLQKSNGTTGADFESPVSCAGTEPQLDGNRSPAGFLEDVRPSYELPRVPYSCPLPFMDAAEELGRGGTAAGNNFVHTAERKGENANWNRSSIIVSDKQTRSNAKFSDSDGLPNCHPFSGLKRMSHSSSLKEATSAQEPGLITSMDKINGDKLTSNKSRSSPLRRMLNPILKPRRPSSVGTIPHPFVPKSHVSSSVSKQPLNLGGPASHNLQHRSVGAEINYIYQTKASKDHLPRVLLNKRYLQQERDATTSRQAFLQLAWKNGLPLFMLYSGDSDILAATVRRKGISDKDDVESVYTVFTIEEPKKTAGAWIKAGNKNKNQQLVSNVIGEIGVSLCKSRCRSSTNYHLHREFVLVGSEFLPSSEEPGKSQVNRELAAIISKVPQQAAETSHQSSSENSRHSNSATIACSCSPLKPLQPELGNASSGTPSVVAILPSGFHGSSSSGEPSPLIERWKLGGACDCGGWDEGCMVTVLTDDLQQCNGISSIQASNAPNGNLRFGLLAQGRPQEDGHAFSMVACKEGSYTVEFRSSIALLQVLALCIAMLHGRSPGKLQVGTQASQEQAFLANQVKAMAATQGRAPASYVSYHPPLSPAGRA